MLEETKECTCDKNCECQKESNQPKFKINQVKAYPAKDPNNNLIAVFEQEIECPKCGESTKNQLIVAVGTIFQFAQMFDKMIQNELSKKTILTPNDAKPKGGIIIP